MAEPAQATLSHSPGWQVELSSQWDVLGPFPIAAREQHYLAPSFPLNLTQPYQHEGDRTWPSALADGGRVGWTNVTAPNGHLKVSFPEIRWRSLRSTEGWAVLQHHAVLRGTLTLTPNGPQEDAPLLSMSLRGAPFFALVNTDGTDDTWFPEWHPGNIYELPQAPRQLITPPDLSLRKATRYHIFIAADYEIRLFGDPLFGGKDEPTIDMSISADVIMPRQQSPLELQPEFNVASDFVDGWAFGKALGIGVQSLQDWWSLEDVSLVVPRREISVRRLREQTLAPSQTRILPIEIVQEDSYFGETLELELTFVDPTRTKRERLFPVISLRHRNSWAADPYEALIATYFLRGTARKFLAHPPLHQNGNTIKPPVLAIHGAGVELTEPFWSAALPRQSHSWIIMPEGLTSWGLDWHGASSDDAWASVTALCHILSHWEAWQSRDDRVVMIGHSNGAQGTFYMAARFPDRVIAAVLFAAYIKSQQYVPRHMSRGGHFLDPAMMGIFEAALMPDDNDLFTSNLADSNLLVLHGGADENVPTWHSRELAGLVQSWNEEASISFHEYEGKLHWYPEVFSSSEVQKFITAALDSTIRPSRDAFTLTVGVPADSGPLHGFAIVEVLVPGRLARLHVQKKQTTTRVSVLNVHAFSLEANENFGLLQVDQKQFSLSSFANEKVYVIRDGDSWAISTEQPSPRAYGPISQLLRSPSPLIVVFSDDEPHALSIARRFAHAALLYFKADVELVSDEQMLRRAREGPLDSGVLVVGSKNKFADKVLKDSPTTIKLSPTSFSIHGKEFHGESLGLVFSHCHWSSANQAVWFVWGSDGLGLERAAQLLLPIRTGVPIPEWVIIGKQSASRGIGGVLGAGYWDRQWRWNEAMSYLS